MTGADVAEVVRALEAATEGGRKLDELVWFAVGGVQPPGLNGYFAPHYTTSLDEALMLVPPQTMWAAGVDEDGKGCAEMPQHRLLVSAATPALALCIASLKARAYLP